MANLQPTDELLVNRGDITYTQQQGTLMANLETTDHLLVNRSDITYKITGEDLINSVIDPLSVNVVLTPTEPIIDEETTAIAFPEGGKAPYTYDSYEWYLADDISGTNPVAIAGESKDNYTPLSAQRDKSLG